MAWGGGCVATGRTQPCGQPEPPGAGPTGLSPRPSEAGWLSPLGIRAGVGGAEPERARGRDGRAGLERSRCPQGTPVCPCPAPVPSCPAAPQAGQGLLPQTPLRAPSPMLGLAEQVWGRGAALGWKGCPVGPQCPHAVPTPSPRPPHSAKLGLVSCACRCRRPGVVNRGIGFNPPRSPRPSRLRPPGAGRGCGPGGGWGN